MRYFLVALFVFAASPARVNANPSQLNANNLIQECLKRQGDGDLALDYANELRSRTGFQLGKLNRQRGAACLKFAFKLNYEFVGDRFKSPETIAALERAEQRAMAEEQERLSAFTKALVEACNEEFFVDRFRALTAPSCREVFLTLGLPRQDP